MIERLELKNFTAFRDIGIDFSSKINVILGENGTGKTHLLKVAYALSSANKRVKGKANVAVEDLREALTQKLVRLFMPVENKLGAMRRHGVFESAKMEACFVFGKRISVDFRQNSKLVSIRENGRYERYSWDPVFIPTKEVLSLARGMTDAEHDQRTVEIIFDDGYVDLAQKLMMQAYDDPESKINLDPRFYSLIPALTNLIGGRYRWDAGGFTFQSGSYEDRSDPNRSEAKFARMYQDSTITRFSPTKDSQFSSCMTAEGFRKIGILQRLLTNGALNPGVSGPLLWDEPESNLNPRMMKQLVLALLELSRNGQQIILATHDYVLLKWFDLLMDKGKDDHIRFHALYRDSDGRVIAESVDDYLAVSPNAIADTFSDLTKEQVNKKMGGLGK